LISPIGDGWCHRNNLLGVLHRIDFKRNREATVDDRRPPKIFRDLYTAGFRTGVTLRINNVTLLATAVDGRVTSYDRSINSKVL
jgi:hypothetical protein